MSDNDQYGITIIQEPAITPTATGRQTSGDHRVFDLVAIHGLNGDRMKTWTHKQSGVMWLRDLLPTALPHVRIMTFGYNARFKNFTATQDLRSISSKLLTELLDVRMTEEEKTRPIVLVCHSLGGIIAKQALLLGCTLAEEQIQHLVYGIIFLGTPHNGSSLATLGKLVANVVSACSPFSPANTLIGMLQRDSQLLLEVTEDFVKRRKRLHLVSFFEMEMTSIAPFVKKLIVEHRSAILNLPEEITIGQYSDHRDIVRFSSLADRNFRPLLSRLNDFSKDIDEQCERQASKEEHLVRSTARKFPILFDVPRLPCTIFHGREDVLNKMHAHLLGNQFKLQRRKFAICGLGGTGKTQIALHFLFANSSNYSTGVMLLNATSTVSLATDFSRIHSLLGLEDTENKIESVKRWLAKEHNSKWLMVFDNADHLDSVPIENYVPPVPWGHVIITSRDQAALGDIAEDGCVLSPVSEVDAKAILMENAGILQNSQDDSQAAEEIVKLLGSLPLAITQAGAFIRSRHKTFGEYRDLYVRRREDVLRFIPRLGDLKTVFTTWEVNFEQVEKESEDAVSLLLLFSFLEPSAISETMFHRGCLPQRRWNEEGEVAEVPPEMEGLEIGLTKLIQDEMRFDAAIDKLLSFSLISCNKETNGWRNFTIHPLVQYCAVQRTNSLRKQKWRWQAILLICHAFPRNRYLDPLNGEIGRSMLPQLARALSEYDNLQIDHVDDKHLRALLAATVLAASRFSDSSWKIDAITRAKQLLHDNDDLYMKALLTSRESAILRMSGKWDESNETLKSFVQAKVLIGNGQIPETNSRYNSQRGDLVISFAENLIRAGELEEAKSELFEWSPLNLKAPSTIERITSRARDIILGKVLRYQGDFHESLSLLERLLEESLVDDFFEGTGWYRVLLSGIADLYCEVGRADSAETLLVRELKSMTERGTQDIATGRRLQISLAEAYFGKDMFSEAEEILLHLRSVLEGNKIQDHTAEVNLFRIWVGLARISHRKCQWRDALARWKSALAVAKHLKMNEGYNAGLVRYSMAHALLMVGDETESSRALEEAKLNLDTDRRIFWIAGFNSRWQDYIINVMEPSVP